jgi:hypothetical protein
VNTQTALLPTQVLQYADYLPVSARWTRFELPVWPISRQYNPTVQELGRQSEHLALRQEIAIASLAVSRRPIVLLSNMQM